MEMNGSSYGTNLHAISYDFHISQHATPFGSVGAFPRILLGPFPNLSFFWVLFGFIFVFRYLRFVVHVLRWITVRPIPLPKNPSYGSKDVSIIIPTICGQDTEHLEATLNRCLLEQPLEILIVTIDADYKILLNVANKINERLGSSQEKTNGRSANPIIKVSSIPRPNKRHQVSHAVRKLDPKSSLVMLVDDDTQWSRYGAPGEFIKHWLAPMENARIGAVGSLQRIKRQANLGFSARIFQVLADSYLRRRNFEIQATMFLDGSTSCLSGRTGLIRKEILQDEAFIKEYTSENWRGRPLNADDDNCLTRWIDNQGWQIVIQTKQEAYCETYLELNHKFITKQCVRWARSTFRSNWTSSCTTSFWLRHPWGIYALILQTPFCSLVTDPALFWTLYKATQDCDALVRIQIFQCMAAWMVVAKLTKLIPMYWEYPNDLLTIPVTLVFGYMHGFIRYYSLSTLHVTGWGTKAMDDFSAAPTAPTLAESTQAAVSEKSRLVQPELMHNHTPTRDIRVH